MRGSGIGYLQGIPAGLDTIKNQKNNRGNTTWANVTRRVYAVGRPKLTTNGSGVGYLQGIPAGFDTKKIRKTTWQASLDVCILLEALN